MKAHYTHAWLMHPNAHKVCHSQPQVGALTALKTRTVFWWQRNRLGVARPEARKHPRFVGAI
jgi:hypothetical protein